MAKELQELQGRVAIVTGSSGGIGRGIAEAFAAAGAKVVLAARRQAALDEVAAGITAAGGTALAVATDVSREADILALYVRTLQAHGRVDIVVNNAGVASGTAIDQLSLADWNEIIAVNLTFDNPVALELIKKLLNGLLSETAF